MHPVYAVQTININTADAAQLASALSGVGEKKAKMLVAWRTEHGLFKSLDDVAQVKGFGPKLIERNKAIIVFSATSNAVSRDKNSDKTHETLAWPTAGQRR
jgi:competence protein ComEA